jgi:hypothetical protein
MASFHLRCWFQQQNRKQTLILGQFDAVLLL